MSQRVGADRGLEAEARHHLRVALVTDTLGRGGAERILVSLANNLDPSQIEVHVIQTRTPGALTEDLAPHVVRHCLNRRSRLDLHAIWRLARVFDGMQIDIVHSHNHTASYLVRLARAVSSRQWVHVVHDHHGPVETSRPLRLLDRLFLQRVDAYVAVSGRLLAYGRNSIKISAERSLCIPNGIDMPARIEHLEDSRFTVVQVARISPEKNQLMALQVASRLKVSIPDLSWVFVGRCDTRASRYARRVVQAAADLGIVGNVQFVGEQADVTSFLSGAHVAVLTSCQEGLPVSLLEAMAFELPVVATDAGSCRPILEASEGGSVRPVNDVAGFAEALAALAVSRPLRVSWGRRNRSYVERAFGVAEMADRFCRLYRHLTQAPGEAASGGS
jgi:glycosyltransferase involved in cell wall biosynthesis